MQCMSDSPLTTTSYAILGQLALRPWTMYELAAEMRRNVVLMHPRVESQIYQEPKRLVARGLASAEIEAYGARTRTRYRITEAGREEVERWLAEPPRKAPMLEFEGLLRTLYADLGTPADLAASLSAVREQIAPVLTTAEAVRRQYLEGLAPFQGSVANRAFVYDFLVGFAELVDNWAARSASTVAGWADQSPAERDAAALDLIRRHIPSTASRPGREPRSPEEASERLGRV